MRKLLKFIGFVALVGYLSVSLAALIIKRLHPSRGGPEDDEVDLVGIYGGLEFGSHAAAFRGGRLLTMFGGSQIDLREARLDPAGASFEAHTIFGGLAVSTRPEHGPESTELRVSAQ